LGETLPRHMATTRGSCQSWRIWIVQCRALVALVLFLGQTAHEIPQKGTELIQSRNNIVYFSNSFTTSPICLEKQNKENRPSQDPERPAVCLHQNTGTTRGRKKQEPTVRAAGPQILCNMHIDDDPIRLRLQQACSLGVRGGMRCPGPRLGRRQELAGRE
jgi:hypothetical protein